MTQSVTASSRRPGELMATEIAAQPGVFARQLEHGLPAIREVAQRIRDFHPRCVLLAARGTSDHAALYAKYLVEVEIGLPVGLASPSTLTGYRSKPALDGVLWLTISQSGGSPDLVESTAAAASCGALTVAVTNAPHSPLATAAYLNLDVLAGPERSVAATKTYTAQLLALWLLVDAWNGGDATLAQSLPELAAAVVDRPEVNEIAARYRFVDKLVTTARGFAYPTAREAALKLIETSYLSAHAFSGADLLHGPLAMIDQDRPVLAIVPEGVGGVLLEPVLERLHEHRADVCVVGDPVATERFGARVTVPLPRGVHEQLSPMLQIIPLQQLALAMSLDRGHDPDAPRGLRKVTETW